MIDTDTINELALEERQYQEWVRHEKNRILSIGNQKRKEEEWHKLFTPIQEPDDSYLEGNVY